MPLPNALMEIWVGAKNPMMGNIFHKISDLRLQILAGMLAFVFKLPR